MKLFVGLGNPGSKYQRNRHNIGFMALDAIADMHGFGPWRAKFQGQMSEGRFGSDKVTLLKPETFMNLSGQSAGEAMRFWKLDPSDMIVFHDELDLAPGKVRVKKGGGHAGHNGLKSLHAHIGPDFTRVRLGIGHPGERRLVNAHVLGDFSKADEGWLDDLLRGIADGAPDLAAGHADRFMNKVALRMTRDEPEQNGPGTKPPVSGGPATKIASEPDTRSPLQRLIDKFS